MHGFVQDLLIAMASSCNNCPLLAAQVGPFLTSVMKKSSACLSARPFLISCALIVIAILQQFWIIKNVAYFFNFVVYPPKSLYKTIINTKTTILEFNDTFSFCSA